MHFIAYAYHWERETVRNMKRSERRMWVKMIIRQYKAEQGSKKDDYEDEY